MDKPANTRYPIHELIAARWSPRAFAQRPVETGKLYRIFEAARWAASSFNEQPWGFIVATKEDEDAHRAIADCLVEGNRKWAELAPVLMISVARLTFEHNDKPNRHAYHDLGQAVALMLVQATDLGLVAHQMAGFDQDKARVTLNIPDDYDP
ncbi:MAG: nitroreductase family protein, partial [Acidobacteria bacterium]|nr:nitroreductase family protein [Acidobacteriota bacterium]